MDLFEGEFLFLDAFVTDAGGDEVSASGVGDIAGGGVSMTLDEYDPETGEPTGGAGIGDSRRSPRPDDDFGYVLPSEQARRSA